MIRLAGVAILLLAALAPSQARAADGKVNINTATAEELALLPRVGPSVAGRIVEFREQNGKFGSLEDLMLVRGIGERTFELIEPWVKLEGETDLDGKVPAPRKSAPTEGANDGR
jgi:competence protein ComEA